MERSRSSSGSETSSRTPRRVFKLSKLKFKNCSTPLHYLINKPPTDTVQYSSKVEERRGPQTGGDFQLKFVYGSEHDIECPNTLAPGSTIILSPLLSRDNFTEVELCLPSANRVIKVQVFRKPDNPHNIQVNIVPNSADTTEEEVANSDDNFHPPEDPTSQSVVPQSNFTPVIQKNKTNKILHDSPKTSPQKPQVVHPLNLEAILPSTVTATRVEAPITSNTQPIPTFLTQKEQYLEGYSARCDHCGYLSFHLLKCVRCNKTIKSKVLISDPYGAKSYQLHKKNNELNGSHEESMDKKTRNTSNLEIEENNSQEANLSNGISSKPSQIPPEEVINEIEKSVISGTNPKFVFTKVFCPLIRVGDYAVKPNQGKLWEVVLSSSGVLFTIPHSVTGELHKCVIPHQAILKISANLESKANMALVFIPGTSISRWIRMQLGMENPKSKYIFCTVAGTDNQRNIAIQLHKDLNHLSQGIIKQLYPDMEKLVDSQAKKVFLNATASNGVISKPTPIYNNNNNQKERQVVQTRARVQAMELPVCKSTESNELFRQVISNEPFEVTDSDVQCLEFEQFLNDTIIYYWIMNFVDSLEESRKSRIHVFNTYFYGRLTTRQRKKSSSPWEYDNTKSAAEKRHCRVQKWTKKVDIFDKDFLIVPVNESFHWFLVIICFAGLDGPHTTDGKPVPWFKNPPLKKRNNFVPLADPIPPEPDRDEAPSDSEENGSVAGDQDSEQLPIKTEPGNSFYTEEQQEFLKNEGIKQPCMLLFDSLAGESRYRIFSTLREYIKMEYKVRKGGDDETLARRFSKDSFPGFQPIIPQQPNTCDCGIYVLEYVEQFFKTPISSYALPLPSLLDWFPDSNVNAKRQEIYNHILRIVTDKHPDRVRLVPHLDFAQIKMEVDDEEDQDPSSEDEPPLPPVEQMNLRKRRKVT